LRCKPLVIILSFDDVVDLLQSVPHALFFDDFKVIAIVANPGQDESSDEVISSMFPFSIGEETHVTMRMMRTITKTEGATMAMIMVLPSFAELPASAPLAIRMNKIEVMITVLQLIRVLERWS
jgi:hypothetical protein